MNENKFPDRPASTDQLPGTQALILWFRTHSIVTLAQAYETQVQIKQGKMVNIPPAIVNELEQLEPRMKELLGNVECERIEMGFESWTLRKPLGVFPPGKRLETPRSVNWPWPVTNRNQQDSCAGNNTDETQEEHNETDDDA